MIKAPWLYLPAKVAHDLSPLFLNLSAYFRSAAVPEWRPLEWKSLRFPNRLGISGGVDKNASTVKAWWSYGAGFIEIGTVTPRPQGSNPGKIIARDNSKEALWNKMGFPNAGAELVRDRLEKLRRPYPSPLFINIGKNRDTSNEQAHKDYAQLIRLLSPFADAFVLNISSPNTQGLRELLKPENLESFLKESLSEKTPVPCLLKVSPDVSDAELRNVIDVSLQCGIDGWILTNTTRAREDGMTFPDEGGVSGRPLAKRSRECLQFTVNHLGARKDGKLLISSGGIFSSEDVIERLDIGADLVQVYTALVFQGPWFLTKVAKDINRRFTP